MARGMGRQPDGRLLHFIIAARGPAPPPHWASASAAPTFFPQLTCRPA